MSNLLKLVVDLDDTLADHTNAFLSFLRDSQGIKLSKEDITGSYASMGLAHYLSDFNDAHFLRYLLPLEDAQWAMAFLSEWFDILICTARDPSTRDDTLGWLETFMKFRCHWDVEDALVFTSDKRSVADQADVFGIVDDLLPNLEGALRGYAFAQPWNKQYRGPRGNWPVLVNRIWHDTRKYIGQQLTQGDDGPFGPNLGF